MDKKIAIVDENNQVVGSSDRSEAHKQGLWHRIVVVLVFNNRSQLYIQKRSPNADTSPNMWDHSAAGHVDEGEEPEQAAKRELNEELGIKANALEFISSFKTQREEKDKKLNRFWSIYRFSFDGSMTLQESEVSEGKFVDIDWLKNEIDTNPKDYTDGLKSSLEAYLRNQ